MSDSVGNSLGSALAISLSSRIQSFTESMGPGDLDFYRFTLGSASTGVAITLNGLTADANIALVNSTGAVVTSGTGPLVSENGGTLVDVINAVLPAGTYFIRVSPGPAADPSNPSTIPTTNYSLNVAQDTGIQADIFWRNTRTFASFAWFLSGGDITGVGEPPAVGGGWEFQTAGDFNGDGNSDIVLRNYDPSSPDFGRSGVWFMNGATRLGSEVNNTVIFDANWRIVGAGDFDGDGRTDWAWRNQATGDNAIWFLNGVQSVSTPLITARAGAWQIQAVGDFNNDLKADIVWRNPTTGENDVWFMDGTSVIGTAPLLTINIPGWEMRGSADYNADGRADLLWRNTTSGENVIWFMNGTDRVSDLFLFTQSDTGWQSFAAPGRRAPALRDLAGNTAAAALNIGPLNGNGLYRGTISASNPTDFYQFTLPNSSQIALTFAGATGGDLAADLDVVLSNATGTLTVNLNQTALTPQSFTTNLLPAGTYTVRVLAKGAAGSGYQLGLNTLPSLISNNPLSLNEGSTQTISSASLLVTDGAKPPAAITYSVVTAPNATAGVLALGGASLVVGSTFTQADINAGRLTYRQNGSETPSTDNFVFSVSNGGSGALLGTIPPTTFSVSFLPTNDPPTLLSTNFGLTLSEGAALAVTSALLSATDSEQAPTQLIYTITSAPTNGSILRSGIALSVGGTFTQADVDAGTLVTYSHNGSEALSDGFTFSLTDGAGGSITPPTRSLSIQVQAVDDAPVLVSNVGITVSEAGSRLIATSLLSATDADTVADQIVYSILSAPTNGTLFRGSLGQIQTFTQADLNNGRIVYGHNGTKTNSDSFTFTVVNPGSTVPGPVGTFNVSVTGVNFIPVLATTNPSLTLSEGARATIGTSILQVTDVDSAPPQLTYTLINAPVNGTLRKFDTALTSGETFFQSDIDDAGRIVYQHGGNETTRDSFIFAVSDQTGGRLANQTFSITVTPVNDPPVLLSNVGLTVDEGATVRIPTSLLSATDADTLPAQLTYVLTSSPTAGTLLLGGTPITGSFTQAALNGGQLNYRHDGSESINDSFAFTLTDGTTTIEGGTFNITVNSVNDAPLLQSNTGLTVDEGGTTVFTGTELFVTDVDGPGVPTFTLGAAPTNGNLVLGGLSLAAGQTFSQIDVSTGALSYVHSGSETASDRFTFTASDGANGLISLNTFSIRVTATNDAPTLTVPTGITVNEDTAFIFSGANRPTVSDVDSTSLTVNLSVLNGTLNISGSGLTIANNGTSAVQVTGTAAALNNALGALRYQGNLNYNGDDTLTVDVSDGEFSTSQDVSITVTPVNDVPVLTVPGAQTGLEDTPLPFTGPATISLSDVDAGTDTQTLVLSVSTNGTLTVGDSAGVTFQGDTANGGSTLSLNGTVTDLQTALNNLVYQGSANYNGSDRLTIAVTDGGLTPITRSVPITLRAVNDAPVFTASADPITVNEDSGTYSLVWATGIGPGGGPDEANQRTGLSFLVASDNTALFTPTGQPAINSQTGVLTFTLAANANTSQVGPATITVRLRDGGGTLSGGVNTSEERTFSLVVNPVNDAPSFTRGNNLTVREDAGPQSVVWATNIRSGPADELSQVLTFSLETLSTTNPNLFLAAPTIDATTGILTYQTNPDANGVAVIRAILSDDGGTDNGSGAVGLDQSSQTFTINVTPVNDLPVLSLPTGPLTVDEDTRLTIPDITVTDVDAGTAPVQVVLSVTNGTLSFGTASTPAATITGNNTRSITVRGAQSALAPVLATLSYQANANFAGTVGTVSDTLTVVANDFGATGTGTGTTTQTLGIVVNPTNDLPTLTVPTTVLSVQEDTSLSITGIRGTDVDSTPLTVTVTAENGNLTLGSQTGTTVTTTLAASAFNSGLTGLTYRGNANYSGPETLTVSVSDGVSDAVVRTLSVNVAAVNDAPVLTVPTTVPAVSEGTTIQFSGDTALSVTDVDSATLTVGLAVRNGTISLASLDGLTVIGGANGSANVTYRGPQALVNSALNNLSYVPATFFNGTDTLTVTASDGTAGATGTATPRVVSLTITPVNNPPVLTINSPLVVVEGNTPIARQINNRLLSATDPDTAPASLVYTVVTSPANGTLRIGSATVTSFTQADLVAGRLTYTHNGSETTTDSFVFQVSDGDAANALPPATFSISVLPSNDAPVLLTSNPEIVVPAGVARVVTLSGGNTPNQPNQLLASDVDTPPGQLVYTLLSTPDVAFGSLLRAGSATPLAAGSTFTQAEINSGAITYSYTGQQGGSDGILLQLSDGTTSFIVPLNVTLS
jgi:VCBS repeat-containing protein